MSYSFNLIDQPWIPCEEAGGGFTELGLRETLARAHELRGISGDSPLETAALYRLLLAVLHRIFGPADMDTWFELWRAGRWDAARLDAYWAQWYDRFELLGDGRRFYQQHPMVGQATPIIHMLHSMGDNPTLFTHVTNTSYSGMTIPQAAKTLIATQVFRAGGIIPGQSDKDGKFGKAAVGVKGIMFIAEGNSVFQTLLLNLWGYHDLSFFQRTGIPNTELDMPAWERADGDTPDAGLPHGYLDYLTWQSFSLWLDVPNSGGLIQKVFMGKGQRELSDTIKDPFKHFGAERKSGYVLLQFNENRALWRDSSSILAQADPAGARDERPYGSIWMGRALAEDYEDELSEIENLPIMALGMLSGQAKIEFYRHERMYFSIQYLRSRSLAYALVSSIKLAEHIRNSLYRSLIRLAIEITTPPLPPGEEARKPGKNETPGKLVDHWNVEGQYWAAIEPAFWLLVESLPSTEDEALRLWADTLIEAARRVYEQACDLAGSDVRALRAAAAGRGTLEWHIAELRKERMMQ